MHDRHDATLEHIYFLGMFLAHRFMVITIEIERSEVSIDDLSISA